jgi:hypothetical protein
MNIPDDNIFPTGRPESDKEILNGLAAVGIAYINDGMEDLESFTNALVGEFGENFYPYRKQIFKASCLAYNELCMEDLAISPLDLIDNIDTSNTAVPGIIVYNIFKKFIEQGYGENIALDFTVVLVQEKMPSSKRSDICKAFIKFVKIVHSDDDTENKDAIEEVARLLMEYLGFDNEIQEIEKTSPPQS